MVHSHIFMIVSKVSFYSVFVCSGTQTWSTQSVQFYVLKSLDRGQTSLLYFKFPPLSHCSHWINCPVTFLTFWCGCFHVITCFCVSYKWKPTFLIRSRIITSKNNPYIFSWIKSTAVFTHMWWRSVVKPRQGRIYKSKLHSSPRNSEILFFCPWASQLVKIYQEEQFLWRKRAFIRDWPLSGKVTLVTYEISVPESDVFYFWVWRLLNSPPWIS